MSATFVHIYDGPWINWSHGLATGMTVTLSQRAGGLLTAFIATFVTICGAELWKLLCYILHQLRSQKTPQDGLYHQQQVILRTSPTPGGAAWLWLLQTYHWAGKARLSFLRSLPWAVFGVSYIVVVGLLAIFSSEISKSPGPQRLLTGDQCGLWSLNTSSPDSSAAWQSKVTGDSLSAATYAKACYGGNEGAQCGHYVNPAIEWASNTNATCPFTSGMCYWNDLSAISITSKMIDSHLDLGINSAPRGRIQFEKTTTCAPMRTRAFATQVNVTEENSDTENGIPGDYIYKFWLGQMVGDSGTNVTNYTYQYNLHTAMDNIGYTLASYQSLAGYPLNPGVYVPIKEISNTNADLSLLFLASNSIRYEKPTNDPLFAAHYSYNLSGYTWWSSDQYVTVLGCSEQYRVCNPNNGVCTPRMGTIQLQQAFLANGDGLNLNLNQNATAFRVVLAAAYSSVYHATFTRGGNALRASETVSTLSQAVLPADQWHIEVGAWFDTGLSRIQAMIEQYVVPPKALPGSHVQPYQAGRDNPYWVMCYNQIVNDSSSSMSFSVLGLAILFVIGGAIIFLSMTIDTVVGYIQHKTGKGLHARMEWIVNDKLQMQRMLHREMKLGQWHEGTSRIPVTVGYGEQKFSGPAEYELLAQDHVHGEASGVDDAARVQLVQEEHEPKGWRS
ncbi:hypothetical protein LTS08_003048 [Lithohypha guttulata]|nr:hypothetical protein LTS08_003048 [Lithohypha guttulata]